MYTYGMLNPILVRKFEAEKRMNMTSFRREKSNISVHVAFASGEQGMHPQIVDLSGCCSAGSAAYGGGR